MGGEYFQSTSLPGEEPNCAINHCENQLEDLKMDDRISSDRPSMITGVFHDRESAERAYRTITDRGYDRDDVNMVMSDETRKKVLERGETELGNKALEGAGAGAGIGGTVGAVAGAIAAIGTSLVIPGLGLVIAGPVAAALAGAGAGSITGGLVGALVGSGMPEERARVYETDVKKGGIVMGVVPRSAEDARFIEQEWSHYGDHIYS
jgi:hypothetical protein